MSLAIHMEGDLIFQIGIVNFINMECVGRFKYDYLFFCMNLRLGICSKRNTFADFSFETHGVQGIPSSQAQKDY